jgi:hypothetical protein
MIRAERRAGEILSEVERIGHRPAKGRHDGALPTYTETIRKADIPETTARRWQAEASIPEVPEHGPGAVRRSWGILRGRFTLRPRLRPGIGASGLR